MSQTITIRLTPKRERILKLLKKHFNVKKNSEAIDLALTKSLQEDMDYESKLQKVAGCISLSGRTTAVKRIRSMRNGA